jgi:hypothetical protein
MMNFCMADYGYVPHHKEQDSTHDLLILTFQVDGVHVEAAFASPAILKLASYLLRDGPTQYHRYIKGSDIKPLLAMTATLCRWALQERKTGRYIASFFVPEAHRVHHDHYVSLLESLPPSHLVLLTSLLLNNGSVLSLQ